MFDYLERIRRKPLEVRRRIAFGSAVTITVLIVLVWIGTLLTPEPEIVMRAVDEQSPMQAIGESTKALISDIREVWGGMRETFSGVSEVYTATSSAAAAGAVSE